MIARSHKTIQGTRIEVIKLPAKDDKNSDDVEIMSINNKKDKKVSKSSLDESEYHKQEEEGDLNCQMFWNSHDDKDIEDHLEFEEIHGDEGILSIHSEIDMIDEMF